ncbi:MAG: 4'-phosphopantetheinyl transferase superfamily protein [Nocardioides sp.]
MTEVLVRWAHVDDLTPAHVACLDTDERARRARLRHEGDRARFTLGGVLLRAVVGELDGTDPTRVALDRSCPRCGEQHGPVTAPGRPWVASVAHSGSFAVAAVTEAPGRIGADLETRCPHDWTELLPGGGAGRAGAGRRGAFVRRWVRKEAVLKATGEGLRRPMTTVRVTRTPDGARARLTDAGAALHVIDLDPTPLLAAGAPAPTAGAVALEADAPQVRWERATL